MTSKERVGLVLIWVSALTLIGWLVATWQDDDHNAFFLAMMMLITVTILMRRMSWYPKSFLLSRFRRTQ